MGEKENNAYKLIISYRDYYGTYHHHKEQMAFSGTGLFLAGATVLVFQRTGLSLCDEQSILLILAGIATFGFVVWQFKMRQFAADMVDACTNLAANWLIETPNDGELYPKLYNNNCLPNALVTELKNRKKRQRGWNSVIISELFSYLIMIGFAIMAQSSLNFSCAAIILLLLFCIFLLIMRWDLYPTKNISDECRRLKKVSEKESQ